MAEKTVKTTSGSGNAPTSVYKGTGKTAKGVEENASDVAVAEEPKASEAVQEGISVLFNKVQTQNGKQKTKLVRLVAVGEFVVTPPELQSDSYVILSSPLDGQATYIPLLPQELEQAAPYLIGAVTSAQDFIKTIREYFANYRIRIEFDPENKDGQKAGFDINVPVNEDGEVIFNTAYVHDIIAYRIAVKSKKCAVHPDDVKEAQSGDSQFMCYMQDREAARQVQKDKQQLQREAMKEFLIYTEESKSKELNWLIRIITKGIRIDNREIFYPNYDLQRVEDMDVNDKSIILGELRDRHPEALLKLVQDKDLELRALLELGVDMALIERTRDVVKFRGEVVGANSEEAVEFFKLPRNNNLLVDLKAAISNAAPV